MDTFVPEPSGYLEVSVKGIGWGSRECPAGAFVSTSQYCLPISSVVVFQ